MKKKNKVNVRDLVDSISDKFTLLIYDVIEELKVQSEVWGRKSFPIGFGHTGILDVENSKFFRFLEKHDVLSTEILFETETDKPLGIEIELKESFDYLYEALSTKLGKNIIKNQTLDLVSLIPIKANTKRAIKMAKFLVAKKPISYISLAKCIKPRLSLIEYSGKRKIWNKQVQNCLRTVKKYWNGQGYNIKSIRTPLEGYQLVSNK